VYEIVLQQENSWVECSLHHGEETHMHEDTLSNPLLDAQHKHMIFWGQMEAERIHDVILVEKYRIKGCLT
jgi:hypothetical protein